MSNWYPVGQEYKEERTKYFNKVEKYQKDEDAKKSVLVAAGKVAYTVWEAKQGGDDAMAA